MKRIFKIAVIDDSWNLRESNYKLLERHGDIELSFIPTAAELNNVSQQQYDGFLIDLNLTNWGLTAQDVIRNYISTLRRARPIFLISEHLADNKFNVQAQVAREACGSAYGDTFAWRDYANDPSDATVNANAFEVVYQRILRLLAGWFAQKDLAVSDDVRILHISDPQFGDPSVNRVLTYNDELISQALFQKLSNNPRPDSTLIDFIVISGDITYSGQKSEFAKAKDWIENSLVRQVFPNMSLMAALERIFVCPGNHDVNLRVMALERMKFNFGWPRNNSEPVVVPYGGAEVSYKREGLKNYYDFLCSIDREAAKAVIPDSSLNWVSDRFLGYGIQFVLLNTASEITCSEPDAAAVDEEEFRSIKHHIRDKNTYPQNITICVGHHPFKPMGARQRTVSNAETIINPLGVKGVCAYLHGHAHDYALESLVPGKMVAVMSPTSNVDVRNGRQGFNLVTIARDPKTRRPQSLKMDICEFHSNAQVQWLDIDTVRHPFIYS